MDEKDYESFLAVKIQSILSLILDREHLNFEEALLCIYQSKLYLGLIDESTKLWHLSPEKLFEMLHNERETNELTLPDYV